MKFKLFAIVVLVLVSSCTITKRRYMPRYWVNLGHKMPKTKIPAETNRSKYISDNSGRRGNESDVIKNSNRLESDSFSIYSEYKNVKDLTINHDNKVLFNQRWNIPMDPFLTGKLTDRGDTPTRHNEYVQVPPKAAKRSLRFGILSLVVPIIVVLIGYVIGSGADQSSGVNNPNSPNYEQEGCLTTGEIIILIFAFFASLAAIVLCILAVVHGIVALNKIKKEPEKYTGKGKALTGLLLGLWPVFATIIVLLIQFVFLK